LSTRQKQRTCPFFGLRREKSEESGIKIGLGKRLCIIISFPVIYCQRKCCYILHTKGSVRMSTPLRALVVEDSLDDTVFLVRHLTKNGYNVSFERVYNAAGCRAALEQQAWDIVIADYTLPGFSGMEALALCKEIGLDIPFIIVSGAIGEDIAVEAMKAGAHDYVMKGHLSRLVPAIQRELREAAIRQERRRTEQALRESEAMYKTLFENSAIGLMFVEENNAISLVNKEMERLSGYSKEDVEGKRSWMEFIINKNDREQMKEYHRARLAGADTAPTAYEVQFANSQGNPKDVVVKVVLIPGTKKSLAAFIDMTELKKTEDALRISLKEKDLLLQELNHRVNNNLQLIANLLRMQRKHVADKTALAVFDESQNRIRSIALVHERLYLTKSFYRINLKDYITELSQHIYQSFVAADDAVKLTIKVEDVILDIERVITCGLIINEMLSNSLKYAFPDRSDGQIAISIRYTGNGLIELLYRDNGIGIPESIDIRAARTLGMQLIVNLAEKQLDGSLSVERDNGTAFKIVFKETPSDLRKEVQNHRYAESENARH
jgi:PAS domain S-box-containing protein